MKVESTQIFPGVNFYTHQPAVVARVNYKSLPDANSREWHGFSVRLYEILPSIGRHFCKVEDALRFSEQLLKGIHVNHVIEHIVLELLIQVSGADRGITHCCQPRTPTDYVVVETRSGEAVRYLVPRAVRIVEDLIFNQTPFLENILEPAHEIFRYSQLGPSGRCIIEAAERRGIPWSRENDWSLVQFGYGRNLHLVQAAATDLSSDIAVDIVGNKHETKKLLEKFSIPTPAGYVVCTEDEAVKAFESMPSGVVLKPLNDNQGQGVSLNPSDPTAVKLAFHHAQQFSSKVMVEEFLSGKNYRVLLVGGKMVGASERQACKVTGDGVSTLEELVSRENENPLRGEGHEKSLTKITLTPNLRSGLLKMRSVPRIGFEIENSADINLSTGATAKDVTDEVHVSVRLMCERSARLVNLDICGIDLMLADISKPLPQDGGGIIEINAAPDLRMHIHPDAEKSRDVGGAIVEMLYPNNAPSRIPIVAITGTNGKTTVTRMIAHILQATGMNIGTTTTDGIMINGENIVFGDTTGPASAKTILSDRLIDVAILETARGGILRRGLGWDWADVGVITNITEDHIGQDGIRTVSDLVEIKALIAERVREGGTLILNADDPESVSLADRPSVTSLKRNIVYFTLKDLTPKLQQHSLNGGKVFFLQNNWVCETVQGVVKPILDIRNAPITIQGTADYQIQNVMAAAAVARAMEIDVQKIAQSLEKFLGSKKNEGRTNLFRVNEGYVLIDYGHNPKAIESVCRMISKWGMRTTAIVSFPGDRSDNVIEACTKIAACGFDRIIIKGDKNLRGRLEGEVGAMMMRIIAESGGPSDSTFEIDGNAALEREVSKVGEREVIVFFYEKLEPVIEILNRCGAIPTDEIRGLSLTPFASGKRI